MELILGHHSPKTSLSDWMDVARGQVCLPQGKAQLGECEAAHECPSHASHTLSPRSWMEISRAL